MNIRSLSLLLLFVLFAVGTGLALYERSLAAGLRLKLAAVESELRADQMDAMRYRRTAGQWERAMPGTIIAKELPAKGGAAPDSNAAKALARASFSRFQHGVAAERGLSALAFARSRHLGEATAEALAALSKEHELTMADIGSTAFAAGLSRSDTSILRQRENDAYQRQLAPLLSAEDLHTFVDSASDMTQGVRGQLGYFSAILAESGTAGALTGDQLDALGAALRNNHILWEGSPYVPNAQFEPMQFYPGSGEDEVAVKEAFLAVAKPLLTTDQYPIIENEIKVQELHISVASVALAKWTASQSAAP